MRGCDSGGITRRSAFNCNTRKSGSQSHRRACAVKSQKRNSECSESESAADTLIKQISGKNQVYIICPDPGTLYRLICGKGLQAAFRLFKCFFSESAILAEGVKLIPQRTVMLLFSDYRAVAEYFRALFELNCSVSYFYRHFLFTLKTPWLQGNI